MTAPTIADGVNPRRSIPAGAREGWWHARDGHRVRTLDLALPEGGARGSLLFLPGRGDFYEKYVETLVHFQARGWQVTAADWRGQACSGRLGSDGKAGHIDDFSTWVDDLAALWADWKSTRPGPHVIVAHSMGGHIVLRALAEGRIDPSAAALTAPMLGMLPAFVPDAITQGLARFMVRLTGGTRQAWRGSEKPLRDADDRFDLLTHDEARYADEVWWRKERPPLWLGAPSWGWIERAIASNRYLETPGLLEKIAVPLLIVATDHDKLVDFKAMARAAARVPGGRLLRFGKEARHEILRESDAVRDKALAAIDALLESAA